MGMVRCYFVVNLLFWIIVEKGMVGLLLFYFFFWRELLNRVGCMVMCYRNISVMMLQFGEYACT